MEPTIKVRVTAAYIDRYTRCRHEPGEKLELPRERAEELTEKGFVKPVQSKKKR